MPEIDVHGTLLFLLVLSSLTMIVAGVRGVRWFLRLAFGPFWMFIERRIQQVLMWLAGILIAYYLGRSFL